MWGQENFRIKQECKLEINKINKTKSLCQIKFVIFTVTAFICGQNQMNSTLKHASGRESNIVSLVYSL